MSTSVEAASEPSTSTSGPTEPMIIGAEVWLPTANHSAWELAESAHSDPVLKPKASVRPSGVSAMLARAAQEHQVITSCHLTGDEADFRQDGAAEVIGGAVAIPTFVANELTSILLLLLNNQPCAVEVWGADAGAFALELERVVAPKLDRWQRISQHVQFPIGSGLPGRAWRLGTPVIENDLRQASTFLRSSAAHSEQLAAGFSIPIVRNQQLRNVLSLLGGDQAALARGCEIWLPAASSGDQSFAMSRAFYAPDSLLANTAVGITADATTDVIGRAITSKRPVITTDLAQGAGPRGQVASSDSCYAACAWPTVVGSSITAVTLCWW